MIGAGDEAAHPPGPELRWSESWTFDFWSPTGSIAGWARLVVLPNLDIAWYHAFLVGSHRQLVAVIDTEVPLPRPGTLEIRTTGLWATHICETPNDHWTVGLEAFGLGLDDPAELYGRQYGDSVPLGFDLEWEQEGPVDPTTDPTVTYHQPCRVSGEILVGAEGIDFDGHGRRERHWGPRQGWDARWFRAHGRLDDGTIFTVAVVDGDLAGAGGSIDGVPVEVAEVRESMGADGIPRGGRVRLGSLTLDLEALSTTPLALLDAESRRTLVPRALCQVSASGDRRRGVGWAEWNVPLQ